LARDNKSNILEGCYDGEINPPKKNGLKYPTYHWTIAFANYIGSKKFRFKDIITIDNNETVLIIYENTEFTG
jgi:hypothetical protein